MDIHVCFVLIPAESSQITQPSPIALNMSSENEFKNTDNDDGGMHMLQFVTSK